MVHVRARDVFRSSGAVRRRSHRVPPHRASNARWSAAALADKMSKSDAARVPLAWDLYVKRCQKLVCHNQDGSRAVARYMFTESNALSWAAINS